MLRKYNTSRRGNVCTVNVHRRPRNKRPRSLEGIACRRTKTVRVVRVQRRGGLTQSIKKTPPAPPLKQTHREHDRRTTRRVHETSEFTSKNVYGQSLRKSRWNTRCLQTRRSRWEIRVDGNVFKSPTEYASGPGIAGPSSPETAPTDPGRLSVFSGPNS